MTSSLSLCLTLPLSKHADSSLIPEALPPPASMTELSFGFPLPLASPPWLCFCQTSNCRVNQGRVVELVSFLPSFPKWFE